MVRSLYPPPYTLANIYYTPLLLLIPSLLWQVEALTLLALYTFKERKKRPFFFRCSNRSIPLALLAYVGRAFICPIERRKKTYSEVWNQPLLDEWSKGHGSTEV
jgi:hypothetical protein